MRSKRWAVLLAVIGLGVAGVQSAQGAFAVYGQDGVTLGTATVPNGIVGGNSGVVSIGPDSQFAQGLQGGGSLTYTSTGGGTKIGGPVIFTGGASFGIYNTFTASIDVGGNLSFGNGANITGPITVGGTYASSFATITGNLQAASNVALNTSFDTVNGNVVTGGNATVKGTITGNLRYAGTLTTSGSTHIGSATQGPSTVTPASYVTQALPRADVFTAGGTDLSSGGSLATPIAPGSYDSLNISPASSLYLTAGDYYFNSITLGGGVTIHFENLTGSNNLRIFVTGDTDLGSLDTTEVNEQVFNQVDPGTGAHVLWETLGNFNVANTGGDNLIGTLFAPNGNISLNNYATVDGSVIAGNTVTAGDGLQVNFTALPATGSYIVPEPASLSILAAAMLLLCRRRMR